MAAAAAAAASSAATGVAPAVATAVWGVPLPVVRGVALVSAWLAGFLSYRLRQRRPHAAAAVVTAVVAALAPGLNRANAPWLLGVLFMWLHGARVRVIGLTGGIAVGKSTVAARFAEAGAVVVDSDALAREVVAPGSSGLRRIVARFGAATVLAADGTLDRPALRRIIMADTAARRYVNSVTHPLIAVEILKRYVAVPPHCIRARPQTTCRPPTHPPTLQRCMAPLVDGTHRRAGRAAAV